MPNTMKRMLVLLLIISGGTRPTADCSSSCSWYCDCRNRGLTSVPQDLPTTITYLHLGHNNITSITQSDFSRYSSLTNLVLHFNQISVINSRAFYNLTGLTPGLSLSNNQLRSLHADTFVGLDSAKSVSLSNNNIHSIEAGTFNTTPQVEFLNLNNNQLTRIRADMMAGLDNLQTLNLGNNNIHSIEEGTFSTIPQLQTLSLGYNKISTIASGTFANLPVLQHLYLSHNNINTFPIEALSNLNIPELSRLNLSYNQMETLPQLAYGILDSISTLYIDNNPWQCDCRMLPFKQKMTGYSEFEKQIRCTGPDHRVEGKSLLLAVYPEDLNCEEPASFSLPVFLSALGGVVVGILLALAVFLIIWSRNRKLRTSSTPKSVPVASPDVPGSNRD